MGNKSSNVPPKRDIAADRRYYLAQADIALNGQRHSERAVPPVLPQIRPHTISRVTPLREARVGATAQVLSQTRSTITPVREAGVGAKAQVLPQRTPQTSTIRPALEAGVRSTFETPPHSPRIAVPSTLHINHSTLSQVRKPTQQTNNTIMHAQEAVQSTLETALRPQQRVVLLTSNDNSAMVSQEANVYSKIDSHIKQNIFEFDENKFKIPNKPNGFEDDENNLYPLKSPTSDISSSRETLINPIVKSTASTTKFKNNAETNLHGIKNYKRTNPQRKFVLRFNRNNKKPQIRINLEDIVEIEIDNIINKLIPNLTNKTLKYENGFSLERLSAVSPEYQIASILFKQHMEITEIVKIERVDNCHALGLYTLKKHHLQSYKSDVEEIYLFHGTNITEMDSICRFNFDYRVYKSQVICFSPYSSFCDKYCDESDGKKVMLLCKVLFDKYSRFGRNVLTKSEDNAFYPEFRITYRE